MRDALRKKHGDRGPRPNVAFRRALWFVWILPAFLGSTLWMGPGLCQEETPSLATSIFSPTVSVSTPERTEPPPVCDASQNLQEILQKTDVQLGDAQVRFPYSLKDRTDRKAENSLAPYLFARERDAGGDLLLLKRMEADVQIVGPIARVKLHQVFQNIGARVVDADYVFPASAETAVHSVHMRIGERIIKTRIEKRDGIDTRHDQVEFKEKRVSVIDQVWPNLLLMNVAHMMPGDSVQVELEYTQPMVPQNATYEFTLPAVSNSLKKGETDSLREHWISSLYFGEREIPPYEFDIAVRLRTGVSIKAVSSPSHHVSVFYDSRDSAQVRLDQETEGNRDFVLQYKLAGDQIESGVLMYQGQAENYIAVLMEPPERPSNFRIPLREFIFVVDVSDSMKGFPLDTAKVLIERLLLDLKASDFLNVVLFAGDSAVLNSQGSVNATEGNIHEAVALLDRPSGEGGAELMDALRAAYEIPRPPARVSRCLVVITDGYVRAEAQMFKFIREHLDEAGLFAFGIGVSVNRALIEGLARAGQGNPFIALSPDRGTAEAERFRTYIKNPVLSEASVSFEDLEVYDLFPAKLPDLMAQRPLVVIGKYRGAPYGRIRISGFTGEERYVESLGASTFVVGEENAPIAEIWARRWLNLLEDQYAFLPNENSLREAVTNLGLCHDLLTPFTRFAVVDSQVDDMEGKIQAVNQELLTPEEPKQSAPLKNTEDQSSLSKTRKPLAPEVAAIASSIRQEAQRMPITPVQPREEGESDESTRAVPAVTEAVFLFTPENLTNPTALEEAVRVKVRPLIDLCISSPASLTFRVEVDEYGTVIGATIVEGSGERDNDACIIRELPGMATETRPSGAEYGSLAVTLDISVE